jgi:hypothetical protein
MHIPGLAIENLSVYQKIFLDIELKEKNDELPVEV